MKREKKIIFRIGGRLGNQLFQYAAALSLAHKIQAQIFVDEFCRENCLLDRYFEIRYATKMEVELICGDQSLRGKLFRKTNSVLPHRWRKYKLEKNQQFDPSFFRLSGSCYLDGYWQSYKYFQHLPESFKTTLKQKLQHYVHNDPYLDRAKKSVVIHVRGTDAAANYGLLQFEYYKKAMQQFLPQTNFIVVSDDVQYAKSLFSHCTDVTLVSGKRSIEEDLFLMSQAHGLILGNSTFSWWGGWLNDVPDAQIIAPQQWHKRSPYKEFDLGDIYPSNWILID